MDIEVEKMYNNLRQRLLNTVPDSELRHQAELACEINQLKREKNAIILCHNYMAPVLFHTVADISGDSLELSRKAAQTDKDMIVFCGVKFMAETAKILSPEKTVLLPAEQAGCSLAESITAEDVRSLKERFPGVPVVTYVNTYADVKAECDICCTSGNAAAVVESLNTDTVIFLPDEFLAKNVAAQTGKQIIFPSFQGGGSDEQLQPEYQMIGWKGRCEVHEKFSVQDIINVRESFPNAVILAHPECSPEVTQAADYSGSTSAMINYVEETSAPKYLLLTECAMSDNIATARPDKEILRLCRVRCPHMNEITLESTLNALKYDRTVIEVPEAIRIKAQLSVERMLQIG